MTDGNLAPQYNKRFSIDVSVLLASFGLLICIFSYEIGRSRYSRFALEILFLGLILIFFPITKSLLFDNLERSLRVSKLRYLGILLLFASALRSPLLPDAFDELIHQTTLWEITYYHSLNVINTLLPISPKYPGLETATFFIRAFTGLPFGFSILFLLLTARVVLIDAIFKLNENIFNSEFAASVAVLIYVASPQFYFFNAQYSYQTLAISLSAESFALLVIALRKEGNVKCFILPTLLLCASIMTHHIVGIITFFFFLFMAFYLLTFKGKRYIRHLFKTVCIGGLFLLVWTIKSYSQLISYLKPILSAAFSNFGQLFSTSPKDRTLFTGASGIATPPIEELIMLISALIFCLLIVGSIYLKPWKGSQIDETEEKGKGSSNFLSFKFMIIPVIISIGLPLTLLAHFAPKSAETAGRSTTFIFFGLSTLIAGAALKWEFKKKYVIAGVMTILFIGSLMTGSGPDWSYTTGPYIVGGDNRSLGAPSVDAATWASIHLPVGSKIAADRDNGAIMAAVGHLAPVTAISGEVNVSNLYFDNSFKASDLKTILDGKIRFLLVDYRLEKSPPAFGLYFEPNGKNQLTPLTSNQLGKFADIAGVNPIYANGPIIIYDLSTLLGDKPLTSEPTFGTSVTGIGNFGSQLSDLKLLLSVTLLFLGLFLWRRKIENFLSWFLVISIFLGAVLVPIPISTSYLPEIIEGLMVAVFLYFLTRQKQYSKTSTMSGKRVLENLTNTKFIISNLLIGVSILLALLAAYPSFRSSYWPHTPLF